MNAPHQKWATTTLGEIATWGSGGTPSRSEPGYYGEGIPWIKTGELGPRFVYSAEESITEHGLKNSSAKLFPAGSVAIAMYGATIGKTSILGIPAATNQACAVGIPHTEITTKEYLYHFLCSQKKAFIEAGKGGAQPNISQAVIRQWEFPLAPLPEQKRIADKLDATLARVDACRERLARVAPILKRFRQSVLAAAVSGRLTADWRAQQAGGDNIPSTTESPDQPAVIEPASSHQTQTRSPDAAQRNTGSNAARIEDVPQGWIACRLVDIADIQGGITKDSKKQSTNDEEIPYLRVANVQRGYIDLEEVKTIRIPSEKLNSLLLEPGDILFNEGGDLDKLGRGWIWEGQIPHCSFQNHVFRARLKDKANQPKYISWWGNSRGLDYFIRSGKQTTNLASINKTMLSNLPIALPPPAEQHEIVRRVESLFAFADRLEAQLAAAQTAAEQLTPALLAKAFRGELVPQDPADEPASELLQRLAASRASADKPKRSRTPRQPA